MHIRHVVDSALAADASDQSDAEILGAPLTDDEFAFITEEYVRPITDGAVNAIRTACDAIVKMRRIYWLDGHGRRPGRRPGSAGAVDADCPRRLTHEKAVAAVLTHDALYDRRDRFDVRRFRRQVLQDRLVLSADVSAWIRRQALAQGRPTKHKDRNGIHVNLLACAGGTPAMRIDRVATRRGSALDHLRVVSEHVAVWSGATPADAARWVLTGKPLRLPAIRTEVRFTLPMRARSRIILTVAPTCTPREVAKAYGSARQAFGRLRRLTSAHARLAVFAAKQGALPGPEQMALWNQQAGGSRRYWQVSVFVRDARQAVQRLMNLRLPGATAR